MSSNSRRSSSNATSSIPGWCESFHDLKSVMKCFLRFPEIVYGFIVFLVYSALFVWSIVGPLLGFAAKFIKFGGKTLLFLRRIFSPLSIRSFPFLRSIFAKASAMSKILDTLLMYLFYRMFRYAICSIGNTKTVQDGGGGGGGDSRKRESRRKKRGGSSSSSGTIACRVVAGTETGLFTFIWNAILFFVKMMFQSFGNKTSSVENIQRMFGQQWSLSDVFRFFYNFYYICLALMMQQFSGKVTEFSFSLSSNTEVNPEVNPESDDDEEEEKEEATVGGNGNSGARIVRKVYVKDDRAFSDPACTNHAPSDRYPYTATTASTYVYQHHPLFAGFSRKRSTLASNPRVQVITDTLDVRPIADNTVVESTLEQAVKVMRRMQSVVDSSKLAHMADFFSMMFTQKKSSLPSSRPSRSALR